jgi:hypothetical protein
MYIEDVWKLNIKKNLWNDEGGSERRLEQLSLFVG